MDWKFEKTEDGKLRLVKMEEDFIEDAEQLSRWLRQLLQEKKLLERDLENLNKKIFAVKAALDTLLAQKEEESEE